MSLVFVRPILLASVTLLALIAGDLLAKETPGYDGVWRTEGYGYVFEIKASKVKVFEITNISCIESGLLAGDFLYEKRSGFAVTVPGFINAFMDVRRDGDNLVLMRNDTNTKMIAEKLSELPERCIKRINNTLANTEKVFLETFKSHYPFFKLNNNSYENFSNILYQRGFNSEKKLFESLVSAVKPFYDSHIVISAPSVDGLFWGSGKRTSNVTDEQREKLRANLIDNYALQPLVEFCNQQLAFTLLNSSVGYLNIRSFSGYSDESSFMEDMNELERSLDIIFNQSEPLKGLVIDVRANSGGSDKLGLAVAQRLATKKYAAYFKQATIDFYVGERWSSKQVSWVKPVSKEGYSGSIVLLTDPDTVSAGETFVMALMGRNNVTRFGGTTRGSFSDILPRTLPNGWLVGIPNERYLDAAGNSYNQTGIVPHFSVDFEIEATKLGRDNVLDSALSYLKGRLSK